MKPVAVLGCGPAGLMAAQAVKLVGRPLAILSEPVKSRLGGAQFLHMGIPGVTDEEPDTMVTYLKRGDEPTYKRKVYGAEDVPFTSFANINDGDTQPAWNLLETYDKLWEEFSPHITDVKVTPQWLDDHKDDFDVIFSSVPLVHLCRARAGLINEQHRFTVQDIWVTTERFTTVPDDTIVYDGTHDRSWYRSSRIFGVDGTEWSTMVAKPPMGNVFMDRKPISTSCNCYPDIIRVGRRGTWNKGVLTHDALVTALKELLPERTG